MHAKLSSRARGLKFGLSLHLHSFFMWVSREGKIVKNTHTFSGCSLAESSTGPAGFMVFVFACIRLGAPEGFIDSGSGLKHPRDGVVA